MINNKDILSIRLIAKGYDFGPAVYKVIVRFSKNVSNVRYNTFDIFTSNKKRKIFDAFLSDENGQGNLSVSSYLTFLLDVDKSNNDLFYIEKGDYLQKTVKEYNFKLILKKSKAFRLDNSIISSSFQIEDDMIDKIEIEDVDKFEKDSYTLNDITLQRACHIVEGAKESDCKTPLIIWLHGMCEGGTDINITLLGNKVTALAKDKIQNYFKSGNINGINVLVLQCPTCWMDNGHGQISDYGSLEIGQPSIYTKVLFNAIDDFVLNHPFIDRDRIYLGGCSNGGYMTMNMMFEYPNYFAAYFPACEAYFDKYISDEKIEQIKNNNICFIQSNDDFTVQPKKFVLPTYYRLVKSGAKNVHFSFFKHVKGIQPKKYYYGHFCWIYIFNDQVDIDFKLEKSVEDYNNIKIKNGVLVKKGKYVNPKNCFKPFNLFLWLSKQKLKHE